METKAFYQKPSRIGGLFKGPKYDVRASVVKYLIKTEEIRKGLGYGNSLKNGAIHKIIIWKAGGYSYS